MNSEEIYNETFVRVTLGQVLREILYPLGVEEDYTELDVFPYQEDGVSHLAVFVAYVQEYGRVVKDLDSLVLDRLVDEVKELGIEDLVNDISVNRLQWRDDKVTYRILGVKV